LRVEKSSDKKVNTKIENNEKTLTHVIKKGENLGGIAKANQMSVDELMRINNLTSNKIHQGQELKINQVTNEKNQSAITERSGIKKSGFKIENNEKTLTHVIKKGETLGSIAKANNMTVDELMRINNLASNKIHQGQELKINQGSDEKSQVAIVEKTDKKQELKAINSGKASTHKIQKGESLISIAKDNNLSVDELKKINNMTDNKIRFGQELKLSQVTVKESEPVSKVVNESKIIQHKVKSGESFYTIAKKYGCTVEDLKRWNRMTGSKIKAGDNVSINQFANN
jgi:LysM repeat protein